MTEAIRNRHPVDELGDVREQIRRLQERESELRDDLIDGECGLEGDDYIATVKEQRQRRLDIATVKKHLGDELEAFLCDRLVTLVAVRPRVRTGEKEG